MAVEPFVTNIYSAIVSWTYVLLVILLIAKIIDAVGGGNLFKGKGGDDDSGRGGGGDDDSKRTKNGISDEDKKELEKNGGGTDGLDHENPGFVQVVVRDEDDNPISGAVVSITPANMNKRKGKIFAKRKEWREYGGRTGPDGVWPSGGKPAPVGSGSAMLKVSKTKWYNITWFNKGRYYDTKYIEIIPKEEQAYVVIMKREGEKAEWFEPKVLEVTQLNANDMRVKGRID